MKKTVLVLLLALIGGWASAQRARTYVSEGFQGPPYYIHDDRWDLEASLSGLEHLMYSQSQTAGGAEEWEGFLGYWPESGLTEQLDGTYRYILIKKNTTLGNNYVSVKYYYEADKNSVKNARVLGLSARQEGGEWQDVRVINEMPQKLGQGILVGKLPDAMKNAKDVQVSLFYTTPKDNTKYSLYFDDFEFFACYDGYAVDFSWNGLPFTANGKLNVDLSIANNGNVMNSCEISYTFDDGAVQTIPLTFANGFYPGETHVQKDFVPNGWSATAYGKHKVEFWISKVDGKEISFEHQEKYLMNIAPTTPSYQYRPVVEHFSSSTCSPCANLNQLMNPIYEELADTMTMVKYQMNFPGNGDPYATSESVNRGQHYGVGGVPFVVLDGMVLAMSGTYAGIAAALKDTILAATNKKVYFDMWFDTVAVDAAQNIHISVKVKSVGGIENAVLHTVVEENVTHGNASSNGETEFHGVMMKMLPNANGLAVNLEPDSTYTFDYVYDMTQTNMEEFTDLKVACFLQASSGEVMQSVISKAGSYSKAADVALLVDYVPAYICAEDVPAGLRLVSAGETALTSVEITAKVGAGGKPVVKTYPVTTTAWGESTYVVIDGLKATGAGPDNVYFTVTKINDNAVERPAVQYPVYVQSTQYAFLPLLEDFTSANNAGSAELNQYVDALGNGVCQIKIPMKGDPYNRPDNTGYATKEGVFSAPGLVMNGCLINVEADGKLANEDYFEALLAQAQSNNSIMKVGVSEEVKISGSSINPQVTASLSFESATDSAVSCLLYAFLVENTTEKNAGSNGEKQIKRVVQSVLPGENGIAYNLRKKGVHILKQFSLNPKVENFDNLKLVVVVKDGTGKEVLQTAEFPVKNVDVANEKVAAYETLSVYPNPASEYVYLKALDNAQLEVFDMNGHKVLGQNGVSGDYTLDVRGYVPGAYIIKVSEGAKVSVARVSVVR